MFRTELLFDSDQMTMRSRQLGFESHSRHGCLSSCLRCPVLCRWDVVSLTDCPQSGLGMSQLKAAWVPKNCRTDRKILLSHNLCQNI
jgi:hypothetical protein